MVRKARVDGERARARRVDPPPPSWYNDRRSDCTPGTPAAGWAWPAYRARVAGGVVVEIVEARSAFAAGQSSLPGLTQHADRVGFVAVSRLVIHIDMATRFTLPTRHPERAEVVAMAPLAGRPVEGWLSCSGARLANRLVVGSALARLFTRTAG